VGAASTMVTLTPSTAHTTLGPAFYDEVVPAHFPELTLRYRNQRAAATVGLDTLTEAQWIEHFGRFVPIPGSLTTPLALRYHGHQFQAYNADLGDGRGFLFAQLQDDAGRLLDLGTKGSGRTPWSRMRDGRLTLKGGVREVLATAILLGFLGDTGNLGRLLDYALATYLPGVAPPGDNARAEKFLAAVAERVAATGADWLAAGFVHGVLNSDNINITGESFDYGPWRFLPHYDPNFTAAYFDQTGLYAFGRQPDALAWNLTRLAAVLRPLGSHDGLEAALNRFWPAFQQATWSAALRRLALLPRGAAEDAELVVRIFGFLHSSGIRYEQFWFDWRGGTLSAGRAARSPAADAYAGDAFAPVRAALAPYVATGTANLDHPYFARAVPRTMLIDEVEALWAPIAERDDWQPLHDALAEIEQMRQAYAGTPAATE